MRPLSAALDRCSYIPEDTKLLILICPGVLYGFPHPDLEQFDNRIKCPKCRDILRLSENKMCIDFRIQEMIAVRCGPVRDRNAARSKWYDRIRQNRILRYAILWEPKNEPEPDMNDEPRFVEAKAEQAELRKRIDTIADEDQDHWGCEEARRISEKLVQLYIIRSLSKIH